MKAFSWFSRGVLSAVPHEIRHQEGAPIHMRTIRHIIDERAERYPDKVYLIAPETGLTLTYGQLRQDCIYLGQYLAKLGFDKGHKLSYMMGNGYQTAKLFLGAMYSGFTVAPLNLMAQPSHLEYVLEHSDTRLVFLSGDQKEKLEKAASGVKRRIQLVQVDVDAVSIEERLFTTLADEAKGERTKAKGEVETGREEEHRDVAGLRLPINSPESTPQTGKKLEMAGETEESASCFAFPEVTEEDDALLLYTSGTTGRPKGVLLSHKNMVAGGCYTAMAHDLAPEDIALCSLPLYHINGTVVTVVAPLVSGGSVVIPHRFSVSNFWQLLSDYRCTWFSLVPTIISYLHSATDLEGKNLNLEQVRFGRSASSALPPSLHKAFEEKFRIPIIETMGLTETAAPVFSNPLDQSKRKYGSPGCPFGNEAKIAGKEGKEAPRGTQGEIMIRGDNVMKGYYKAPDLTARAIEPDGWLHTGDIGYMDADGFVFVTGRIKELIIKGGENIAPREIDEAVYCHPAVLDCAAVGIPDAQYGEEIMCCVVLKPGFAVTEDEMRSHCQELLGEFKTPKLIRFMENLPKGPSGKIQRIKLRDMSE
ncbi:AMP-binding protein [Candidatus Poribacteria bacterium]|nr:AMP-binding protein [Candidatus Poribacteria bacterium]